MTSIAYRCYVYSGYPRRLQKYVPTRTPLQNIVSVLTTCVNMKVTTDPTPNDTTPQILAPTHSRYEPAGHHVDTTFSRRSGKYPLETPCTIFRMVDSPANKASRRKRLRQSFPVPLDQVAIRHVDAIRSLDEDQRAILARAIAQTSMANIPRCLAAIKNAGGFIKSENDLIALVDLTKTRRAEVVEDSSSGEAPGQEIESVDLELLASLLLKYYPDMPPATADTLVGSYVLTPCLKVVAAARLALRETKSDFVITVLYTLVEQKLNEIEQIIGRNPAFIKAMQLSRPDLKPD